MGDEVKMQKRKIMWAIRLTLAIACFCILLFVVKAFPSGLGLDLGLDLGTGIIGDVTWQGGMVTWQGGMPTW